MAFQKNLFVRVSTLAIATGLLGLFSLGGCPVPQTPSNVTDSNNNTNQNTDDTPNVSRPVRPVPPPPIDTDDGSGSGGGTGGGGTGGGGTGGGGTGGGSTTTPITIVVTAPDGFDINILPGAEAFITYEVFGGNAADGPIAVKLFRDVDGIRNSGDEVVIAQNLAPRGTHRFNATFDPGAYRFGIEATNTRDGSVVYASGRLVLVGQPTVTFTQPSQNLVIRPNTAVTVGFQIQSLASAVSYTVFTDQDGVFNGNETNAFSGGGLGGTGTILTNGFAPGRYQIGITITDSVGQTRTEYFRDAGGAFRTFDINETPTVLVTSPSTNIIADPANPQNVVITAHVHDPEGAATVTIFRDTDAVFNQNEVTIGTPTQLTVGDEQTITVTISTADLPTGATFRFGAAITDGVGSPIAAYAAGSVRVNGPPVVTVTQPNQDVTVQSGTAVQVRWTVFDPENRLQQNGIRILIAPDANNDRQPDSPLTEVAALSTTTTTYNLDTSTLVGRYLVAVRAIDDVGAVGTTFAAGSVNVLNEPPTVVIDQPANPVATRPNPANPIPVVFTIGDRERQLRPQPDGVRVFLVRDDDENGQPDGDPVANVPGNYRLGLNFTTLDAALFLNPPPGAPGALLNDRGFGRFLLVVRAEDSAGNISTAMRPITIDLFPATLTMLDPVGSISVDRVGSLLVRLQVTNTSETDVRVVLDLNGAPLQRDTNPNDQSEVEMTLVDRQPDPVIPFTDVFTFSVELPTVRAGRYNIYTRIVDRVGAAVIETTGFYNPQGANSPSQWWKINIRDRLIGDLALSTFDTPPPPGTPSAGAVLRGFNINDIAGSAMTRVPDVDGDGDDEFMITSRFGKAYLLFLQRAGSQETYGFGESYLIYGNNNRLQGVQTLNAVGQGNIPGLIFPGIRVALNGGGSAGNSPWVGTEGISDATFIPDMDGDGLPELVFGFPRAESMSLSVADSRVASPSLFPDLPGMGSLEFNAWDARNGVWNTNIAQFVRGGVVIASSHNTMMTNPNVRSRRNNRSLDLHEVGQMFSAMSRPGVAPYIVGAVPLPPPPVPCVNCDQPEEFDENGNCTRGCGDCGGNQNNPDETEYTDNWTVLWDVNLTNQGPGGFHQPWTIPPADPPLANASDFTLQLPLPFYPDRLEPCDPPQDLWGCTWLSDWYVWGGGILPFPCTDQIGIPSWNAGGSVVWTGFYGPQVSISNGAVGARILGQSTEDRFGFNVASEGVWLYISAPQHTARAADVPALNSPGAGGNRAGAGVVYMQRVDSRPSPGAPTRAQLWMELATTDQQGQQVPLIWPQVDAQEGRTDDTMPVPHQYIIETGGSLRSNISLVTAQYDFQGNNNCPPGYNAGELGADAGNCRTTPYPPNSAGWHIQNQPQEIVGPHTNAHLRYTRALGDVNGDGIPDVAVGTLEARENFLPPLGTPTAPTGPTVGGVYVIYSRPTGVPGDVLLERLAYGPDDLQRLNGVYLKGTASAPIGRSFDNAGDFNGDGADDFIVGSELSYESDGQAIVLFGSATDSLLSPELGWRVTDGEGDPADVMASGRAIRFKGSGAEKAGFNVTGIGDVDGDGFGDILITAPDAVDPNNPTRKRGIVYLVYGSDSYVPGETYDLDDIGRLDPDTNTLILAGVKFLGRSASAFDYAVGGGSITDRFNVDSVQTTAISRGVAALGDIDGDGLMDYAISAIQARPNNRRNAGEVFVIYGRGDAP